MQVRLGKDAQINNEGTCSERFNVDANLPPSRVNLLVTFLDEFTES